MRYLTICLTLLIAPLASNAFDNGYAIGDAEAESLFLRKHPQLVRDGGSLRIKTADLEATFTNNTTDGESAASYSIVRAFTISTTRTDFLVKGQYYEGRDYTLVNGASGAKISLPGIPSLSHYHWYLVTAYAGEDSEGPSLVEIIQASDFSIAYKLDYNAPGEPHSGPVVGSWMLDNQAFILRRIIKPNKNGKYADREITFEPLVLNYLDGKWVRVNLKE